MKKRRIIKSIFASMLAIIMVLNLTSIVSAVDPKATLTIKNTVDGKTVDLYQVFSAAKNTTTNAVSYTLKAGYENFFKSNNKYGCNSLDDSTALSDAAYKYVAKLSSNEKVEFVREILEWSVTKKLQLQIL